VLYAKSRLGSPGRSAGIRDTLGSEIAIKSINCRFEDQVAIRAALKMALDFALDRSREAAF
jgi:hypothetical protein